MRTLSHRQFELVPWVDRFFQRAVRRKKNTQELLDPLHGQSLCNRKIERTHRRTNKTLLCNAILKKEQSPAVFHGVHDKLLVGNPTRENLVQKRQSAGRVPAHKSPKEQIHLILPHKAEFFLDQFGSNVPFRE